MKKYLQKIAERKLACPNYEPEQCIPVLNSQKRTQNYAQSESSFI